MGPRTKIIYDLFCETAPVAAAITAWITTYNLFEVRYPPHDLRSSGPFKWQRRPVVIAWAVAIAVGLLVGLLLV